MNKFSTEFLVQKESIDFLSPYIKYLEVPVQQIPMMQQFDIPQEHVLETKFPAFSVSQILETSEMRIQVLEDLTQIYPGMKKIEKIYSAKFGEIELNKFHESCKNHEITLSLAKSCYHKVFGFLCPMKWKDMKDWTKVTGGKT